MNIPKIAVIIPAKGNAPYLSLCLESVLNLNYPDFEVIFVNDGVAEEVKDVLGNFKDKIRVITSNGQGPSYARNFAAKETDAEYLAFTDSDCIVDKEWLNELLKGFEIFPDAVSCGGRQELPNKVNKFEEDVMVFLYKIGFLTDYIKEKKLDEIVETEHNPSCNVMYKRDVFLEVHGFLVGLWPGEDVELDWRLKSRWHKLVFNSKALVLHHRPKDWKAFKLMMFRYGLAQGFLFSRYGLFRKIHWVPIVLFVFFVAWATLAITYLPVGSAIFGLILFILYVWSGSAKLFALNLVALFCWNIGFLRGLFFKI